MHTPIEGYCALALVQFAKILVQYSMQLGPAAASPPPLASLPVSEAAPVSEEAPVSLLTPESEVDASVEPPSILASSRSCPASSSPCPASSSPASFTFELLGQTFMALNGGPSFKFSQAISLFVACDSQTEIDRYWSKLTADGGKEIQCGWLVDKFGVSWQIVPRNLGELLSGPDAAKSGRAMQAMLKMQKLDIATLKRAYEG
jgi:predicted 3-demethylubiquinone-9 3-methyltransferase (glyoxalase superfamily)